MIIICFWWSPAEAPDAAAPATALSVTGIVPTAAPDEPTTTVAPATITAPPARLLLSFPQIEIIYLDNYPGENPSYHSAALNRLRHILSIVTLKSCCKLKLDNTCDKATNCCGPNFSKVVDARSYTLTLYLLNHQSESLFKFKVFRVFNTARGWKWFGFIL